MEEKVCSLAKQMLNAPGDTDLLGRVSRELQRYSQSPYADMLDRWVMLTASNGANTFTHYGKLAYVDPNVVKLIYWCRELDQNSLEDHIRNVESELAKGNSYEGIEIIPFSRVVVIRTQYADRKCEREYITELIEGQERLESRA